MAGGRGGAFVGAALLCLMVLHCCETANAATFVVGGKGGWSFNVAGWANGKRFRAGDTLVFQYTRAIHNVVVVNKAGFDSCTSPRGSKLLRNGIDRIKLVRGRNFFICSIPGHCRAGMKIAITAF